jgi:hypothetical protein
VGICDEFFIIVLIAMGGSTAEREFKTSTPSWWWANIGHIVLLEVFWMGSWAVVMMMAEPVSWMRELTHRTCLQPVHP